MINLLPNPYHYDLYKEYLNEIRFVWISKFILYSLGWACFFTYVVLLFGYGVRDSKYFLLDVSGLLLRFSGIILNKQFEIPKIFDHLLDSDIYVSRSAAKTIVMHRNEIMGRFLTNVYGRYFPKAFMALPIEEISSLVRGLKRKKWNWRKIGPWYFTILICFLGFVIKILV
jgi:hypothetical protein